MTGVFFLAAALLSAKSPLSLLLAVLAHEGAHVIFALFRGMGLPEFSLCPAGISLRYNGLISYTDNLFLCLSGPFFSIVLFFVFRGTLFSLYSLGLGIVNLLPVSCLDGGGALNALAMKHLPIDRALALCRTISVISVLLLCVFNILIQMKIGFNITLLAVTLYTTVTVLGK